MTHRRASLLMAAPLIAALLGACGGDAVANNGGATQAGSAQAGSPVRIVLTEFDRACSRPMAREAYIAAAAAAGWEAFEPPADSPLGRVIALSEAAARDAGADLGRPGEARIDNSVFRKTAEGRELFMLVSQARMPGMALSVECRVYDFAAPAPTEAEVAAWASTPANNRASEQGLTAWGWQPGFREGFSRIDLTHLDPSSPLRSQIPISGLSITAFQGPTTAE